MEDVGSWAVRKRHSRRGDGACSRRGEGRDNRGSRQGSEGRAAHTVLTGVEADRASFVLRAPRNAGPGRGLLVRAGAAQKLGKGRAGSEVQAEEKSQ
jgi:hypothetical protein